MPIILATSEAEIRESWFQASLGKQVCETASPWKKLVMVAQACHSSNSRKEM
jgi:hypothetical protein